MEIHHEPIVHNNYTQYGVIFFPSIGGWQVWYKTGDNAIKYQAGSYFTKKEAENACFRYAQP